MNNRQSLYLLWATILNQSQSAEKVLKNTFELFKRLNLFSDFEKGYKNLNYENIERSITIKPCLHRFPMNMSINIWDSVCTINKKYKGNPKEVFEVFDGSDEVKNRLMEFRGIGEHKADTAIIILKIYNKSKGLNSVFDAKCTELYKTILQEIQILDMLGDVELDYDRCSVLKFFRELQGNDICNTCKEYNNCRGGCRYRCFKNGDINGIDPFCYLRNNSNY